MRLCLVFVPLTHLVLAGVALTTTACRRAESVPRDAEIASAHASATAARASMDAGTEGVASVAAAARPSVGMADLSPVSAAAMKENDAAVALLASGKTAPAVAGFTRALELSPGFVLARYNLACARARASDDDGAERELGLAFEADWVGLRVHAARDKDLADFWSSEQGKRQQEKARELEARYAPVIERGVRAMLWNAATADATEPEGLRLGVWDSQTARFVPTTERARGALAGYVSADFPYAVLLTGSVPKMLGGDMSDHVIVHELSYWPFSTAGAPIATSKVDKGAFSGKLVLRGDEVSLRLRSAVGYGDEKRPDLFEAKITFSPASGTESALGRAFLDEPADQAKGLATLAMPFHNGFESWSSAPGYAWKDRKLEVPSGKAIEVPREIAFGATKPSIAASPNGALAALIWDTHSCTNACDGRVTVGSHRIVLVDVRSGTTKKIADGTGVGAVRFDQRGRMFVQRDRQVFDAMTPDDPTTWRELPRGVLLVPPVAPEPSIRCCGF